MVLVLTDGHTTVGRAQQHSSSALATFGRSFYVIAKHLQDGVGHGDRKYRPALPATLKAVRCSNVYY